MRNNPDCLRTLMTRFWRALLFMCAAAAIFSITFVLWTLVIPLEVPASDKESGTVAVETISRERLRAVLDTFEQRDLRYQKLRSAPPKIDDPSR
jgi:hypothetical protein